MENNPIKLTIHLIGRDEVVFNTNLQMKDVVSKIDEVARNGNYIYSVLDVNTKEVYSINTRNITYVERTKEKRKSKFVEPTKQEIYEYAQEQKRLDLADKFYDWYNNNGWKDKNNKSVRNWKNKFLMWVQRSQQEEKKIEDNTKMVADGVCEI